MIEPFGIFSATSASEKGGRMPRLELAPDDAKFYRSLRECGGLSSVVPAELDQLAGVVACLCGDCDQRDDILKQQQRYCIEQGADPRIHILALNGGALRIPCETPIYGGDGADAILLRDIVATLAMKEMRTVVLYGHAPCGAANQFGLTGPEVITLLIRAKDRVREVINHATPGVIVVCKFHIDWGCNEVGARVQRTYFLKRRQTEALLEQTYQIV